MRSLMLGTAQYPSPKVLAEAFRRSGAGIATVSVRREAGGERAGAAFWDLVRDLGVRVLPNTAGCHSVREAVTKVDPGDYGFMIANGATAVPV